MMTMPSPAVEVATFPEGPDTHLRAPVRAGGLRATLLATAAAALLLGAALPATAATLLLSGIGAGGADAGADGSFETLLTGPGAYNTGRDAVGAEKRWALEFDLSGLPSGAAISSATLSLRTSRPDLAGQIGLSGYTGNGTMATGDMSAGALLSTFTPTTSLPFDLDVTAFLQGLGSSNAGWAGFNLRQTPLEAVGSGSGDAWNGPESFPAPALTIVYTVPNASVPEPATALLATLALGGLALSRTRRQSARP